MLETTRYLTRTKKPHFENIQIQQTGLILATSKSLPWGFSFVWRHRPLRAVDPGNGEKSGNILATEATRKKHLQR